MKARIERLRKFMGEQELDAIIINKPENRRYFSGFTGSAGILLVSKNKSLLLTDFRYIEQATKQATEFEIVRYGVMPYELIGETIRKLTAKKIGFESDFVTYDVYQSILNELDRETMLIPCSADKLRECKDTSEFEYIRKAVDIADRAFSHILTKIRPGVREIDIALDLEYYMRSLGAEREAFETIVASGWRGALPHGRASEKVISVGEMVTLDFGAVYKGYHSDITRTIVVGKADQKQKEIYQLVLDAQLAGCDAVKPGIIAKEVDGVSRNIINTAGYGQYFGHGLGHGVGLAIHEGPRVNQTGETILAENMFVTVEPGVYLPDWGGVRIEDTVRVGAQGPDIITKSSKQLIEIV